MSKIQTVIPKYIRLFYGWVALNPSKYIHTVKELSMFPCWEISCDDDLEFNKALRIAKRYRIK
jgi:hypothetical protein